MPAELLLPQVNALAGPDKDALTNIFAALLREVNRLNTEIDNLRREMKR